MKTLCVIIGAIVLLLVLSGSGVMRGDVCIGSVGCVGAGGDSIRIHPAPARSTP